MNIKIKSLKLQGVWVGVSDYTITKDTTVWGPHSLIEFTLYIFRSAVFLTVNIAISVNRLLWEYREL